MKMVITKTVTNKAVAMMFDRILKTSLFEAELIHDLNLDKSLWHSR